MKENIKERKTKSSKNEIKNLKVKKGLKKIALVGNPNVGKSVMFYNLTGIYATVSNYPGTTVEVTRGTVKIDKNEYEVIDTPGMYSILSITEEEKVARQILFEEKPDFVVHVVDSKNIQRMLLMTIQLIEADFNVILVLNMSDELEKLGKIINAKLLEERLGIPVVEAISTQNKGTKELINKIRNYSGKNKFKNIYDAGIKNSIEKGILEIEKLLPENLFFSKRIITLLLLQEDNEIEGKIKGNNNINFVDINKIIKSVKLNYKDPLDYVISIKRLELIKKLLVDVVARDKKQKFSFRDFLSKITMQPLTGIPILIFVLYFGLYKIVGQLGAGIMVDFLNGEIFVKYLNPFFTYIAIKIIPIPILQELFVGEYGILTLGLRYSFAIILPIITVFFFIFAIIEDSGTCQDLLC